MKKQEIRIIAKAIRNDIDKDKKDIKDKDIVFQIKNNINYLEANLVGIYYPFNSEINIRLLVTDNKRFAYPKMINNEIVYLEVSEDTKWDTNQFGLTEPAHGEVVSDKLELLIVPALAVNKNNYRIGYGRGYYDKFIAKHKPKYTIGVIYEELKIEFTEEPHDVRLNEFISN